MKLTLAALLIAVMLQTCKGRPSGSTVACNEAADILFVVDTSSSIWPGFYGNIKTFLKDVISSFKIGPGPLDSRVGVLTFSTREYLEFHLNKHKNTGDILKAIDGMRFRGGDTYTHRALDFVTKVMLTPEHGSREGVAKLVVVLTDGKSVNAKLTTETAAAVKAKGADIFAVGVGNGVDFQELHIMASSPSQQFVFQVTDFKALDGIKNIFAQTTCEVLTSTIAPSTIKPTTTAATTTTTTTTTTTPTTTTSTTASTTTTTTPTSTTTTTTPTTTESTTTTAAPTPAKTTARKITNRTTTELLPQDEAKFDERCRGKPADIYFLLDASSSVWIGHFHDRVLPFVRDLVESFHISPLYTRVGLVTFSNDVNHEFGLSAHSDLKSLQSAIQPEHVEYLTGGTNTGDAIEYVMKNGFGSGEARKGVAQIIILTTDGLSQNPKRTAEASEKAREKGVYIFAVGVGQDIDEKELSYISSNPDEDFVFSVDNFKALSSITQLLAQKTCKAVSKDDSGIPDELYQCSKMASNVVFVYDYINSISASKVIVQDIISDFIHDVTIAAPLVKVGIVTQPCVGGTTPLQHFDDFQESLINIRRSYNIEYTELVRQARTVIFQSVPMTEQRVAILIVDDTTRNLDLLQIEVMRLKFTNVKVIIVAVGKVDEVVLEQLASTPYRQHVLRADSYSSMKDDKLDILRILCSRNPDEIFREFESVTSNTGLPWNNDNLNNKNSNEDSDSAIVKKEDQNNEDIINIISLPGSINKGHSHGISEEEVNAGSGIKGGTSWYDQDEETLVTKDTNEESHGNNKDGSVSEHEPEASTVPVYTFYFVPK